MRKKRKIVFYTLFNVDFSVLFIWKFSKTSNAATIAAEDEATKCTQKKREKEFIFPKRCNLRMKNIHPVCNSTFTFLHLQYAPHAYNNLFSIHFIFIEYLPIGYQIRKKCIWKQRFSTISRSNNKLLNQPKQPHFAALYHVYVVSV